MNLTPRVAASGDVTLELQAEFSLLGDDRNIGSDQNKQVVPTFLTRTVNANLRLREGETGLIGGLVQGRDARSFGGAIGMNDVPILGKLLGSHSRINEDSEILISITPHIVRGPKLTEEDFIPLRVGTQEVPRVEGARPALFGPEPEGPAAGGGAPPAPGRSPAPFGGVGVTPVPVPVPGTTAPMTLPPITVPPATNPTGPGTTAPMTLPPIIVPPATNPTAPGTTAPMVPPPITMPSIMSPAPPPSTPSQSAPSTTSPPVSPSSTSVAAPGAVVAPPATLMLSPPEVSLRTGQSAGISLVLVGGRDVQWIEMILVYDPALAEVTDVAPGSLLTLDGKPVQAERALEPGRVRVRFNRATPVTGSGGVAALTLRGLRPGSGTLAVESSTIGRTGGTDAPVPPAPGRLVVAP
jgi:general secretion pathway protein D